MSIESLIEHEPFVRRYVRSLVHGAPEADDVVQETWLAAIHRPPEQVENPRGWLAAVARNALRGMRRSGGRRAAREEAVARDVAVPSATEVRAREDARRAAVLALLDLEPIYRDALLLRYFEDLPPREIAIRLDLGVATVKTRLKRGLGQLRERLDAEHDGDRRAWALPLLPLAGAASADAAASAASKPGPGAPRARRLLLPAAGAATAVLCVLLVFLSGLGGSPAAAPAPVPADLPRATAAGGAPSRSLSGDLGLPDLADLGAAAGRFADRLLGRGPRGGIVVDPEGRPVRGAHVAFVRESGRIEIADKGATGADGRYELVRNADGKPLLAWLEGKMSTANRPSFGSGVENARLEIGPAGTVRGRVTDPISGGPVADATVELRLGWGPFAPTWRTETDEAGEYRFDGVPFALPVFPGVASTRRALPLDSETPKPRTSDDSDRLLRERRGVYLQNRRPEWEKDLAARRSRGVEVEFVLRPAPGVRLPDRVTVNHRWSGSFTHAGTARSFSITFEDVEDLDRTAPIFERFLPEGDNTLFFTAPGLYAVRPDRTVEEDGPPESTSVELRRRTPVVFQLVDEAGKPLRREGVRVTIWEASGSGGNGNGWETDAAGRVDATDRIPPPGTRTGLDLAVTVRADGYYPSDLETANFRIPFADLDERLASGVPVRIDVPLSKTHPYVFEVVDREGNPVPGVVARCLSKEGRFATEEVTSSENGLATAEIRWPHRAFGERLEAKLPWVGSLDLDRVFPSDGRPRLVVTRGTSAAIRILDDRGSPLANTGVLVGGGSGTDERTDAAGEIVLPVPRSTFELLVRADGFLPATAKLDPSTRRGEVRLQRARELRIVATVPDDALGRLELKLMRADGEMITSATARVCDGRAEWSGRMPAAALRVRAFAGDEAWTAEATVGAGEEEVALHLAPTRRGELALLVSDPEGRPLADEWIALLLQPLGRHVSGRTDEKGGIRLLLPVGEYRIRPRFSGHFPRSLVRDVAVPSPAPVSVVAVSTVARQVRVEAGNPDLAGANCTFDLIDADRGVTWIGAETMPSDGGAVEKDLVLPVGRFTLRVTVAGRSGEWSWSGVPGIPEPFRFE